MHVHDFTIHCHSIKKSIHLLHKWQKTLMLDVHWKVVDVRFLWYV